MVNTKLTPGTFRCFDVALPDEPMFILLGRDPAARATIEFWAHERKTMGKDKTADDMNRIFVAQEEALAFAKWREDHMRFAEANGQEPVWRLPRVLDDRTPAKPDVATATRLLDELYQELLDDGIGLTTRGRDRLRSIDAIRAVVMNLHPVESIPAQFARSIEKIAEKIAEWWTDDDSPRPGELINGYVNALNLTAEALRKFSERKFTEVRSIRTHDESDPAAPGGRVVTADPALAAPYGLPPTDIAVDPTFREKIAIGLRQVTEDMKVWLGDRGGTERDDAFLSFVDRINGYVAELEASRVDPYETFAAHLRRQQEKPVSHLWSPGDDGDEIRVTPLSFSRMAELLDYATCYGEFDENTPNGTQSKYPNISTPMNDVRRGSIWAYKRAMGIIPDGVQPPVAEKDVEQQMKMAIYSEGLFQVPGVPNPQTMDQIAAVYRYVERMREIGTIGAGWSVYMDITAPQIAQHTAMQRLKNRGPGEPGTQDLAESPDLPPHRFAMFTKGKHYAYARGLEVNPGHLPQALDAMAEDGWYVISVFGATDSKHVGFLFERRAKSGLTME